MTDRANTTVPHYTPGDAEVTLREVLPRASKRPWLMQRNYTERDGEYVEVVEGEDGQVLFGPTTYGSDRAMGEHVFREGHAENNAKAVAALGNAADEILAALDKLRDERRVIARSLGADDDCMSILAALAATLDVRRAQGRAEGRAECIKVLTDAIATGRANKAVMPPAAWRDIDLGAEALQQGVKIMERIATGTVAVVGNLVVLAK